MESKIKILKVLDILLNTSEKSPVTASKICEMLKAEGIDAERKSVCRDINTLIKYGYKIVLCHDNKLGYYMEGGKAKKTVATPSRPTVTVTLEYSEENEAEVERIFGKKTKLLDEEGISAEFRVESDVLFTRLIEAGEIAQIIAPEDLRSEFIKKAERTIAYYNKPKRDKKIEVWLL